MKWAQQERLLAPSRCSSRRPESLWGGRIRAFPAAQHDRVSAKRHAVLHSVSTFERSNRIRAIRVRFNVQPGLVTLASRTANIRVDIPSSSGYAYLRPPPRDTMGTGRWTRDANRQGVRETATTRKGASLATGFKTTQTGVE